MNLAQIKQNAQAVVEIAAKAENDPSAEAQLHQALEALESACNDGGGNGAGAGGDTPAGGDGGAGSDNYAGGTPKGPRMDDFHGYAAEQVAALTANFSAMQDAINELPRQFREALQATNGRIERIETSAASDQKKAKIAIERASFSAHVDSEVKTHSFDAPSMLAAFDASDGKAELVESLKKLIAASPLKSTTPAEMGTVFDAETAGLGIGWINHRAGLLSERDVRSVVPGSLDDPKLVAGAAKLAASYRDKPLVA